MATAIPSLERRRARRDAALVLSATMALSLVACGGGTTSSAPRSQDTSLRRHGTSTANGDAIAAAWLLASGIVPAHASTPATPLAPDARLAQRLAHHARDHVWCASAGCADGPNLAGSARIRRLAAASNAPGDTNANGTNLDETLDAELRAIAALAATPLPDGIAPILALRARASALLVDPVGPGSRDDLAAMRTATPSVPELDPESLGWTLLARTWLAQSLASGRRGASVGATPHDGLLAVLAIEQALAIEESVLTDLAFDGSAFVPIADPPAYDAATAPRWMPGTVRWTLRAAPAGTPSDWLATDRSSELLDLAVVMRGAAELGWLTCHGPLALNNNYSVAQYEHVFLTGLSGVPGVTPGDHAASAMWRSLDGPWTPPGWGFPLAQMPFGLPRLPQSEIDTIARWIDEGALREQPPSRPRPRPGLDLARVLFRTAVALHEVAAGPRAGLLDRRAGASRSELAGALDTGAFLVACAALASLDAVEPGLAQALERMARAAMLAQSDASGAVYAEIDLRDGRPIAGSSGLGARSAFAAGLLAAGRVTGRSDFTLRGIAVADRLIADSWHDDDALFDSLAGAPARVLRARDLAWSMEMLRELQLAGRTDARALLERATTRALAVVPFAELDGDGEVLRDGLPDTDGNGVVEPSVAGHAPLLSDFVQHGPEPSPGSLGPITWSAHVLPLFRVRCAGCHVDGASLGSYRVDTPSLAATPGDSGTVTMIVPGDPSASFLVEKLSRRTPSIGEQMPQRAPPLADHELAIVRAWIEDGARDR
ncbi:MAG: hypothetical protein HZB39_11540 [Planctomycetes bacterium]|nr:hypothetical protein [Planctomycetota bacterium]